jgi:hypothetical protein
MPRGLVGEEYLAHVISAAVMVTRLRSISLGTTREGPQGPQAHASNGGGDRGQTGPSRPASRSPVSVHRTRSEFAAVKSVIYRALQLAIVWRDALAQTILAPP